MIKNDSTTTVSQHSWYVDPGKNFEYIIDLSSATTLLLWKRNFPPNPVPSKWKWIHCLLVTKPQKIERWTKSKKKISNPKFLTHISWQYLYPTFWFIHLFYATKTYYNMKRHFYIIVIMKIEYNECISVRLLLLEECEI